MILKKFMLIKSQQGTTKDLNSLSVQRVITFRHIENIHVLRVNLLNKRMPDSKKYIHVYTKSRKKDEQTSKLKKKEEKNEMLLDSNPHLLSGRTASYP